MVDGQVLGAGVGAAAAQRARQGRHHAAHRRRPADAGLARIARRCRQRPVYPHQAPQAVEPRAQRLARVREAMARHGASHHFVSTVDDVAWITSLRGGDVEYNPVFLAHLLLDATARHAVRRRRQDRRGAGGATGARRHHAGRLCGRVRCAAPAVAGQRAADRPAPHHAGLSPAGARWRARDRGHQPEHAVQEPQERTRGAVRARGDGARRRGDVRVLCLVREGDGRRRAHHRAHDRRTPERRARQATGLRRPRASPPSRRSMPTARCRTTAPPNRTTR